jgi:hypothetical protein
MIAPKLSQSYATFIIIHAVQNPIVILFLDYLFSFKKSAFICHGSWFSSTLFLSGVSLMSKIKRPVFDRFHSSGKSMLKFEKS